MGWMAKKLGFNFRGIRDFSLLHNIRTGSGAHPASYPMGMRKVISTWCKTTTA
jgi:hypothetical protein